MACKSIQIYFPEIGHNPHYYSVARISRRPVCVAEGLWFIPVIPDKGALFGYVISTELEVCSSSYTYCRRNYIANICITLLSTKVKDTIFYFQESSIAILPRPTQRAILPLPAYHWLQISNVILRNLFIGNDGYHGMIE